MYIVFDDRRRGQRVHGLLRRVLGADSPQAPLPGTDTHKRLYIIESNSRPTNPSHNRPPQACGRVVCSTCLRHRLPVSGLRGLQKACDDCARAHAAKRKEGGDGTGALGVDGVMRGACESISEDTGA